MVRRKAPRHAPRAACTTSHSPTAEHCVSARDYYNRRYKEVDKKRRSTGLYEDSTESHMNRMEGLWKEYVECPSLHASWILLLTNEPFQVLQGGQHRSISYAQEVSRGQDQQILSLDLQRVHRPESELRHHVLAPAQPSIYQIQGSKD